MARRTKAEAARGARLQGLPLAAGPLQPLRQAGSAVAAQAGRAAARRSRSRPPRRAEGARGALDRAQGPALGRDRRPWSGSRISFVAFAISAQIQKIEARRQGRQASAATRSCAVIPQNILVLGTDVRAGGLRRGGRARRPTKCVEPPRRASRRRRAAGYRADTLMVLRAGGGAFSKLSIPRDTLRRRSPGAATHKINGAYAFGGAKLQIETVEELPRDRHRPGRDRRLRRLRRPDQLARRDQGRPATARSATAISGGEDGGFNDRPRPGREHARRREGAGLSRTRDEPASDQGEPARRSTTSTGSNSSS